MEEQQCLKLTVTNSSIGLIVLINLCPQLTLSVRLPRSEIQKTNYHDMCFSLTLWFLRGAQDPIPSRTRPSNPSAPMVLSLKTWESRSLQGLPKTQFSLQQNKKAPAKKPGLFCMLKSTGIRAARHKVGRGLPTWQLIFPLIAAIAMRSAARRCPFSAAPSLRMTNWPGIHAITWPEIFAAPFIHGLKSSITPAAPLLIV